MIRSFPRRMISRDAWLARRVVRTRDAVLFHPLVVTLVDRIIASVLHNRIRSRGCTVDTSSTLVRPWVKSLIFWGFYEKPEILFVQRYLRADLDVIELGSSLGVVAAQIAKRIAADKQLITVEADPRLVDVINANVHANARTANVTVMNAAIDYSETAQPFVEIAFGESNLSGHIAGESQREPGVRVATTTLSALLAAHAIQSYALVSDIEGAEAGIIEHEQAALAGCAQIIIELHDTTWQHRNTTIEDLSRALQEKHGFKLRDRMRAVFVFDRA